MKHLLFKLLDRAVEERTPLFIELTCGGLKVHVSEHSSQFLQYQTGKNKVPDKQYHAYYLSGTFSTYRKSMDQWEKTPGNFFQFNLEMAKLNAISIGKSSCNRYLVHVEGMTLNFLRSFKQDPFTETEIA